MGWCGCVVFISAWLHVVTGQNPPVTSVRLVNGNATAGRVEVEIGGVFGTVCDDLWDDKEATVVCKQLGLTGGKAFGNAYFGNGTGPILMDDVDCKGDEKDLNSCYFSTQNNCQHNEDASVVCQPANAATTQSPIPASTRPGVTQPDRCTSGVNPQAKVRLFGPQSQPGVGYVQVQGPNGQWGYVCDDGWDVNAAKVVCKELCYQQSLAESTMKKEFQVGVPSPNIILDDVACVGTESRLEDCSHRPWSQHNCDASELAAVTCVRVNYPTPTPPSPNLQCRDGDLIALFNRSRDPNLEPKHLSLGSPCADLGKDASDPNFITVTIPFDKCGTNVTQNQTHIIYSNTIIIEPTSREGAISRVNTYHIQLICEMPRNATVDRDVQPLTETITQRAEGVFVIKMTIYQDSNFQQAVTVYPYQLTLGQWLNAAVELEAIDDRLKLVVTDCLASPNVTDTAAPSLTLLRDKCVAERATLEMHPLNKLKMGMRLQSFSFVNYPLVVLQCNAIVCLTSEVTSECDRSCNNSKPTPTIPPGGNRRRRDVSESDDDESGNRQRRDVSEAVGASTGPKTVYTVRSLPVVVMVQPLTGPTPPIGSTTPFFTPSPTPSAKLSTTSTTTTTPTTTSAPTTNTPTTTPTTTTTTVATTESTSTTEAARKESTTNATSTLRTSSQRSATPPSTEEKSGERAEASAATTATTTTTTTTTNADTLPPIFITVRGTVRPPTTPSPRVTTPTPTPMPASRVSPQGVVVKEGVESAAPCRMCASSSSSMLVFLVLVLSVPLSL